MVEFIAGIIWDWNGTLLNDMELCVHTINEMLQKRNLHELSVDEYKEVFSFPVKDYYQKIGFDYGACLAERVCSVERIRGLLERARKALDRIQCHNVVTKLSDGSYGWAEEAPFDAILITAGAPSLPQPLLGQLKVGGSLVIPVGDRNCQRLIRVRKDSGGYGQEVMTECNFVSLVGEYGWTKREKRGGY